MTTVKPLLAALGGASVTEILVTVLALLGVVGVAVLASGSMQAALNRRGWRMLLPLVAAVALVFLGLFTAMSMVRA